jgi:hypothetical protein
MNQGQQWRFQLTVEQHHMSSAKAQLSICLSRESASKEIDESDLQDEKHDDSRISTFRGISIDLSDDRENACDSIRCNREFDSNEIDESE